MVALFAQADPFCKDENSLIRHERDRYAGLLDFRSNPATHNYDLTYQRMEWAVDPRVRYISGTITSYFVPQEAGFQELNFDLSTALRVTAVTRNGAVLPFSQSSDDLLIIDLPAALPEGELDSVSVTYEGVPAENGFGSFVQSTHNESPIIWTLSEPYGAKDWWPCKQDLVDKVDSIDVVVTTPAAYRVASNGVLVEESSAGGQKRYHWKHRYPIATYLIAIGVTDYAVYSDFVPVPGGEPIEVLNYVYPEALQVAKGATPRTVELMQLFNELFGLYPFATEKYGHAMFGFGGGMEHQTMSFMSGFSHLLQAHELAHQWFGDKVTCGSWSDIWLNEGFASYLEGLTYEYGIGPNTWLNWKTEKVQSITSLPYGSVFVTDTTNIGRVFSGRLTYNKAAMLVHMLRWKLGDEAFFQAVRNYLEDPELAYGYARTADLKRHLETESGVDLTAFFKDWLYGEGYPTYLIFWESIGNKLTLEISQTTSDPSVDFFEMPLPIFVNGVAEDTMLRVEHDQQLQRFEFDLGFEALGVVFDPNVEIISAGNMVTQRAVGVRDGQLLDATVQVYPNPAREAIQVVLSNPEVSIRQAAIADVFGRQLRRFQGPENRYSIADLPAGLYILSIETNRGTAQQPFVKQ